MQRFATIFSLVFAGEAIFGLPFHIARFFRPTFLEVFQLSQTQLGVMQSIYGIVATFAYFFGGIVTDRFTSRVLLTFGLLITAASGLYMATIPSFNGMCGLYAFWGLSTIFPFWSALIRATRIWGGEQQQGRAFGLLDCGRGLLAAVLATISVSIFAMAMSSNEAVISGSDKRSAMQTIIFVYIVACFLAAFIVWLWMPVEKIVSPTEATKSRNSNNLKAVLAMPVVWLQALVIMAAYSTYKGIDFYTSYAFNAWHWSESDSPKLTAYGSWMRPIAAILAGLSADRFRASRIVTLCFVANALAYVVFLALRPGDSQVNLLWLTVITNSLGVYALRGVYFALMEEANVPLELTGTAVGVASFIGFLPEIFMPLLGGRLIDHWSGRITGYQAIFAILLAFSIAGAIAAWAIAIVGQNKRNDLDR